VSERPEPAKQAKAKDETRSAPAVENRIHKVNAKYASFGMMPWPEDVLTAAPGPKSRADVAAELEYFVPPTDFARNVEQLRKNNVLVLTGPNGFGKRTSALKLAYEATRTTRTDLVQLSPAISIDELRETEYAAGTAYFIVGYVAQGDKADAEFQWEALYDTVRAARAFLIITTTVRLPHLPTVAWRQPDLRTVLNASLADLDTDGALVQTILPRVPAYWTLTNIGELVRRVRADPARTQDHLDEVFDLDTITDIDRWFTADDRDWVDIVEVTALVFAWGVGERRFESLAADLEAALARSMSLEDTSDEAKAKAAVDARSPRRKRRTAGLIQPDRLVEGGVPRQVLVFKSPRYRLHVLNELWMSYRTPFWDGLRDWLYDLVGDDGSVEDDELWQISQGVALFAQTNLEEALDSYVRPWASGEHGIVAMGCAAAVLCAMAKIESVAPAALQLAVRWVGGPFIPERITAGAALTAELGERYPAEAARRLWQLIAQDDMLHDEAFRAPAELLGHLAEVRAHPGELLAMLEQQAARLGNRRVELKTVQITLQTLRLALSATTAPDGNRLASFDLLDIHPDCAPAFARLWAAVLANRRFRVPALEAIWDGLRASADPLRTGKVLGDALMAALPPSEYPAFARDFRTIDRRKQHGRKNVESLADILVSAVERMHSPVATEASHESTPSSA
jgi:hypothetical protein